MSEEALRIAMLVGEFPARSTTFIENQIRGLQARGHEVDVIAARRGDVAAMDPRLRAAGLLDRTTFVDLPISRFERVAKAGSVALKGGSNGRALLKRSLDYKRYGPLAASGDLLFSALSIEQPREYDILHCQFAPNALRGLFLRDAGLLSGRLITSFHGYGINTYPVRYGKDVYRSLFSEGDLFMANTQFIADRAASLGCPRDRLVQHPMGVDLHRFEFRARDQREIDVIRIVATGRLVEVKGFEFLIRAVREVHARRPNVRLEILGDGPLRRDLMSLAAELGLSEIVEFAGGVNPEEVRARYAKADLFAMAGVRAEDGAEEGQGVVFAEAQACGLPVVATRTGGISEAILDGESGFLVEERDVDALAERIEWLVAHPESRATMGQAGRRHVEATYDLARLNDELEALYFKTLG